MDKKALFEIEQAIRRALYHVQRRPIVCKVCANEMEVRRRCIICRYCGIIHWVSRKDLDNESNTIDRRW